MAAACLATSGMFCSSWKGNQDSSIDPDHFEARFTGFAAITVAFLPLVKYNTNTRYRPIKRTVASGITVLQNNVIRSWTGYSCFKNTLWLSGNNVFALI